MNESKKERERESSFRPPRRDRPDLESSDRYFVKGAREQALFPPPDRTVVHIGSAPFHLEVLVTPSLCPLPTPKTLHPPSFRARETKSLAETLARSRKRPPWTHVWNPGSELNDVTGSSRVYLYRGYDAALPNFISEKQTIGKI